MKLHTLPRRAAAALLAAAVFCTATLSVFASDSAPASSAADSAPSGSGASLPGRPARGRFRRLGARTTVPPLPPKRK